MKYHGYGRFIVHRIDGEFQKYELMHSEVIQFGHTVPYRMRDIKIKIKDRDLIQLGEAIRDKDKLQHPNEWLDSYVSDSMPYELENMIDAYDFEVEDDGYAEICGFILVTDTSSDTPYGYEYDSELSLEEPEFTPFKLEDLKQSDYYNAGSIAEWERGGGEEEHIEERYNELVAEGYSKTWEHLQEDEEAVQEEYRKMMDVNYVPKLPKQEDIDKDYSRVVDKFDDCRATLAWVVEQLGLNPNDPPEDMDWHEYLIKAVEENLPKNIKKRKTDGNKTRS